MRLEISNFESQLVGLSLALTPHDIDALVRQLTALKADADQHFHLSNNPNVSSVLVDIEIGIQGLDESGNGDLSGFAIDPTNI